MLAYSIAINLRYILASDYRGKRGKMGMLGMTKGQRVLEYIISEITRA